MGKVDFGTQNQKTPVFFTSVDLTKRIVSKGAFQVDLMAGVEYAKLELHNDASQYFKNYATYEIGAAFAIGRFVLPFSISHYNPKLESGFELSSNYYFTTGIGLRF